MKHARKDYDRIQDPAGLIPDDEPVLLIRGQDVCAPAALEAWCKAAEEVGVDPKMIKLVDDWAMKMIDWQHVHGVKVPDMPADV